MDIPYLINLLQNKINYLNNARAAAAAVGDVGSVTSIDQDILSTQNTVAQLDLLVQVSQAAQAQNTTPLDLLSTALDPNPPTTAVQGPSASAIVNGYDISAYATDALYEQKVQAILDAMPALTSETAIDAYIQGTDPGSPITAAMVLAAANAYTVDIALLLAIMQNDSAFGTLGVGATTNNPGNVGNTGTATQSYPSWADGVAAVAEWLSRHRVPSTAASSTSP